MLCKPGCLYRSILFALACMKSIGKPEIPLPQAARLLRTDRKSYRRFSQNFEVGDFVLIAKREFRGGEKLGLRWQGPHRLAETRSDYVYEVEDLKTKVVTFIHSTRLRFYHDSSLDVTADILAHLAHQNTGYEVRAFRDLKYDV
jgi:hypothetical protein